MSLGKELQRQFDRVREAMGGDFTELRQLQWRIASLEDTWNRIFRAADHVQEDLRYRLALAEQRSAVAWGRVAKLQKRKRTKAKGRKRRRK